MPGDGEVIEGVAYVNEAAITGESAPVLKEPGTDIRSSVTGGTTVVSDWLVVRITADPGETFLDRMIALVEGANRQKTPNEIALSLLLSGLTWCSWWCASRCCPITTLVTPESPADPVVLVALFVTLIPTTIGGLLSAIGIAGMDRVTRFNVMAKSGSAVEAAGDSTRCCSTRPAPSPSATGWPRPSGRSPVSARVGTGRGRRPRLLRSTRPRRAAPMVALAREKGITGEAVTGDEFVPFSASTRLSGVTYDGSGTWKGAGAAVRKLVPDAPAELEESGRTGGRSRRHPARWSPTAGRSG